MVLSGPYVCILETKAAPRVASLNSLNSSLTNRKRILLLPTPESPTTMTLIWVKLCSIQLLLPTVNKNKIIRLNAYAGRCCPWKMSGRRLYVRQRRLLLFGICPGNGLCGVWGHHSSIRSLLPHMGRQGCVCLWSRRWGAWNDGLLTRLQGRWCFLTVFLWKGY